MDDLLKYGNELEIVGMIMGNGQEERLVFFPESSCLAHHQKPIIVQPNHEKMKELLYQLDTLGVENLQKTILRKSQRQIEQNISWNVFRRDRYSCVYCGIDTVPLTVDHIVLWEHMGASIEDNLNSACRKCNKTRGNMLYPDWLNSDYYAKVSANLSEFQKNKNANMWAIAQKVPLRPSQRNR